MTVELSVSDGDLAAALSEMRIWLDRNNYTPTWFGTGTQELGAVLIRVDFDDDSEGEAFRRAFEVAAPAS